MENNNYNQYVLWAQAYDTFSDALVVVDGERIAPNDSRYISLSQEAIHISKDFSEQYSGEGTTIYKTHNSPFTFLIMSHFVETDIVGRRIAYCCKTKATSMPEAIQLIQTEVSKFGYNIETGINKRKCPLPKLSKNHIISIFSAIILFIIFILSLVLKNKS